MTAYQTNLAKQVERLVKLKMELDELRNLRIDPSQCPYRVEQSDGVMLISHREGPRGRWVVYYEVSSRGGLWYATFVNSERTTVREEIKKTERLIAEAKGRGAVKWEERKRLDAMSNRQVKKSNYGGSGWVYLSYCWQRALTIDWKTPKTETDRREQREIKRLLSKIERNRLKPVAR